MDFLHRVGRTARAGQPGLVTSLYTKANHNLVTAIRQAGKQGQPVVILETSKIAFFELLGHKTITLSFSPTLQHSFLWLEYRLFWQVIVAFKHMHSP